MEHGDVNTAISIIRDNFPKVAISIYQFYGKAQVQSVIDNYKPNNITINTWDGEVN